MPRRRNWRKFVSSLMYAKVPSARMDRLTRSISQNIRKAIFKCNSGSLENHILQPASLLKF